MKFWLPIMQPETSSFFPPENRPGPKKETHLPTIHFSGAKMLNFRRVGFHGIVRVLLPLLCWKAWRSIRVTTRIMTSLAGQFRPKPSFTHECILGPGGVISSRVLLLPFFFTNILLSIYTLEVNHHFKNGGSFWKMINLTIFTIKNGGSETLRNKKWWNSETNRTKKWWPRTSRVYIYIYTY